MLALSASFLLGRKVLVLAAALAALVAVPPGAVKAEAGLLHEEDSLYQFIQVIERDDGRRLLRPEGVAVHSVWREDTVLTGGVWDAFPALPPPSTDRSGRWRSSATRVARPLARWASSIRMPASTASSSTRLRADAGREYFGMEDNLKLTVYDADARLLLRRTDERYDLIIVDAYHQPYVPSTSPRASSSGWRDRLTPGGIVALNVASVPGDESRSTGSPARSGTSSIPSPSGRRSASTRSCSGSTSRARSRGSC